jgi:cytochrome o ubiquinol oxidase subunit 1
VFSEIVSTFSGKRLFGYTSMVYATVVITILSYLVWLHHFFTMGSGASVNSFFGITTMIISIPTGAKIFNWLFTMYRGRIRFEVPMLWTIGFMVTFVIGGMTGVLLAVPPADFVLHNSLFLIAHFHNVIIGGVVFGMFAGINYWFPKAFGFKLNEFWGKCSFWFWLVGFYRLHAAVRAGPDGRDPSHEPLRRSVAADLVRRAARRWPDRPASVLHHPDRRQIRDREAARRDRRPVERPHAGMVDLVAAAGYNFAFTPVVHDNDAWADMKKNGYSVRWGFVAIHMPKNTGAGFIIAAVCAVGFA